MIIQIRGTSGSGKTWAMKRVMELLGPRSAVYVAGRKQPLYYQFPEDAHIPTTWAVYVLGHYEIACGGCDTLGSARETFDVWAKLRSEVSLPHTLMEGLLLSEDSKWTLEMNKVDEVRVIYLTTPVEQCLERIRSRRARLSQE